MIKNFTRMFSYAPFIACGVLMSVTLTTASDVRAEDMRMAVDPYQASNQTKGYARRARRVRAEKVSYSRHERRHAVRAIHNPYASQIAHYASMHGVPVKLADAVVRLESRYNPRARNGANLGLTQVSYTTAKSMGYGGSPAGLFEPSANLNYGIKYLAQAYRLAGGDTCRTIMKYQSGHRAVSMNGANRTYCGKVRTVMASN